MKKTFSLIIIITITVLLLGCGEKAQKDNKSSDQLSSSTETTTETLKDDVETFLVSNVKKIYENKPLAEGETVTLNLGDLEKDYEIDISKYKENEYNCDLIETFVTINGEADNKRSYTINIDCK